LVVAALGWETIDVWFHCLMVEEFGSANRSAKVRLFTVRLFLCMSYVVEIFMQAASSTAETPHVFLENARPTDYLADDKMSIFFVQQTSIHSTADADELLLRKIQTTRLSAVNRDSSPSGA
jgi:hypothetical protein